MKDKIVLVTGATNGIGRVMAQSLAGLGAVTCIVGRDPDRTEETARLIRASAGNPQVHPFVADLSSQTQIRQLARRFQEQFPRLDILVNNAGAFFWKRELSVEGVEMSFALNHLGYFSLTLLLLDMLRASPAARVVNVSSEGHRGARLNFSDLQNERHYSGQRAYRQSKLANLYFTYGLAASLSGERITVNALHPGLVATNFGKSNSLLARWLFRLASYVSISPQEGAQTGIYLAISPEVETITGKYFIKNTAVLSSPVSYDMSAARKLWDHSLEMTGITRAL